MAVDWSGDPQAPLRMDGVALEYACYGPSPDQAPTIVILHEGLGCLALWRDFPQRVAERTGMGVFVYSRRGYGKSDPVDLPRPLDFMTREATEVLPVILEQIGLRRGLLLGHSDGATISAIYAGSIADHRIRGLILMAPHFFTEPPGLLEIEKAAQAFDAGPLREKLNSYHRDAEGAFRGWADTWLNPEFREWNVADVIDYLRIPILVIQGLDDQYGTLAQISEVEDRAYSPVDRLILAGCKHAPHQEFPEQVLDGVGEFVDRLQRIEAARVQMA